MKRKKESTEIRWDKMEIFIDGKEIFADSMTLTCSTEPYFLNLKPPKSTVRLEIKTAKKEDEGNGNI